MLKRLYLSIKKKVFVKLILLIIIPNILFVVIINQLANHQIQQFTREMDVTLSMIGHATSRELQGLFDDVITMSNHIAIESEVQRILSGPAAGETARWNKDGKSTPFADQETMRSILSRYRMIWNDVYSIAVISRDGDIYISSSSSSGPGYRINGMDLSRSSLFREVTSPQQSGLAWSVNDSLTQSRDMITIARKIYGMYNANQVVGYVVMNLPLDAVRGSFEVYNYYEDMLFGMVNHQENRWMTYENEEIIGGTGTSFPIPLAGVQDRFFSMEWEGRTWWAEALQLKTGDYLVVGLDAEYIQQASTEFRNRLYAGLAFFLILACIISIKGTRVLSERLGSLRRAMKSFGQKKWGTRIQLKGSDEIQDIAETFNSMAIEIENLLEDLKKQQHLKRTFELRVLEYQINPHFLYNTLDSIYWLALDSEKEDISQMVNGLSKLFRLILSKGKEVITLEEEFEMARIYLDIQKIRFGDRFEYEIVLDPEMASYPISKLVLQPIVENAIIHGVRRLRSPGKILITGRIRNEHVVLEIADNGVGMTAEKVEEQLDLLNADVLDPDIIPRTGYGMKNVDSRLKLLFSNDYHMNMESRQEQPSGTTVQIKVKKDALLRQGIGESKLG